MEELKTKSLNVQTSEAIPLDVEAIRYLVELGKQSRDFKIVKLDDGRLFVNSGECGALEEIDPFEKPVPENFAAFTLSGLVGWLHEDVDKLFERFPRLYVKVESPTSVSVLTPGHNRYMRRSVVASCEATIPAIKFNAYMLQEDFLIHLQTRFIDAEDYETVAKLSGNVRMENDAQTADDGMSQRITIKDGVSAVTDAIVKNPFLLTPKRTFEEIAQPVSPFVFRVRKGSGGPELALFEADGGAWKNEAVAKIGEWLKEKLSDLAVVVIA